MAAARKNKGTVGVIGLGIMGGAFAKNLNAMDLPDTPPTVTRSVYQTGAKPRCAPTAVHVEPPSVLSSIRPDGSSVNPLPECIVQYASETVSTSTGTATSGVRSDPNSPYQE